MRHDRAAIFPQDFLFGTATSSLPDRGPCLRRRGSHALGHASPRPPATWCGPRTATRACDHYHRWEAGPRPRRRRRASTPTASRPPGRGCCRRGAARPTPRVSTSTTGSSTGCCERGIKPCATLYHWELPSALADLGAAGRTAISPSWFAEFTEVIMGRIGDRVYSVAPINEPWCVGLAEPFPGPPRAGPARHPRHRPRDAPRPARARTAAIAGDARAWGCRTSARCSTWNGAEPVDDSPEAARAAATYDGYYNRFFLDGDLQGRLPRQRPRGPRAAPAAGLARTISR